MAQNINPDRPHSSALKNSEDVKTTFDSHSVSKRYVCVCVCVLS